MAKRTITKSATAKSAVKWAPRKPIAERIELPGISPTTFKLVEWAADSFHLFRSSRRIGTARLEANRSWTARVGEGKAGFVATAKSAPELLRLVGAYLLAQDARERAAAPLEESNPELRIKGKKSPEERLSIEFAKRAQAARLADIDAQIAELRRSIGPAVKR